MDNWFVYILECSDSTFYTGCTNNLFKRIDKHNSGNGAKYTKHRRPVKLLKSFKVKNKSQALKLENKIKQLSRKYKILAISNSKIIEELIMKINDEKLIKAQAAAEKFKEKLEKLLSKALSGKKDKSQILVNDVAELINYCDLIIKGKRNFKKAYSIQMESLDTEVRDLIPTALFNIILEEAAHPQKDVNS